MSDVEEIRERLKHQAMLVESADATNSFNDRLRRDGGYPSPNQHVTLEQRRYVRDVTCLLVEIDQLRARAVPPSDVALGLLSVCEKTLHRLDRIHMADGIIADELRAVIAKARGKEGL